MCLSAVVSLLMNTASYSESNTNSPWLVAFRRLLMATVHYQADNTLLVIMMKTLQHLCSVKNLLYSLCVTIEKGLWDSL